MTHYYVVEDCNYALDSTMLVVLRKYMLKICSETDSGWQTNDGYCHNTRILYTLAICIFMTIFILSFDYASGSIQDRFRIYLDLEEMFPLYYMHSSLVVSKFHNSVLSVFRGLKTLSTFVINHFSVNIFNY